MHLVRKKPKRGGGKPTHPRNIDATTRALEALKLREQNLHYREIAALVGYNSPDAAQMAVSNLIKKTKFESVDEYREIIRGRLEKQAANLLPFTQPQGSGKLRAISVDCVREYRMLQAELAKLHGCYVEVKVFTGPNIENQNIQNNIQQNVMLKVDLASLSEDQLREYRERISGLIAFTERTQAPSDEHREGNGQTLPGGASGSSE